MNSLILRSSMAIGGGITGILLLAPLIVMPTQGQEADTSKRDSIVVIPLGIPPEIQKKVDRFDSLAGNITEIGKQAAKEIDASIIVNKQNKKQAVKIKANQRQIIETLVEKKDEVELLPTALPELLPVNTGLPTIKVIEPPKRNWWERVFNKN